MKDYYKQELGLLRETAARFAEDNPTLAGGLREISSDPDIERLMEGFAFLTGHLHQELDGHYPRFLQTLAQVVSPQYTRPLPSATIIEYQPKVNLQQSLTVRRGVHMEGQGRDTTGREVRARFRTCFDVDVRPLAIRRVDYQRQEIAESDGRRLSLQVDLQLQNTTLAQLTMPSLRFFLGGSFAEASDLLCLLRRFASSVEIRAPGGQTLASLPPQCIKPVGFGPGEGLLGDRSGHLPAFEILREYFVFPEKFLFIDLDLSSWGGRPEQDQFQILIHCTKPPFEPPSLRPDSLVLHATPAVNLFPAEANPLVLNHREPELRVTPAFVTGDSLGESAQVYAVDSVEGIVRGQQERRVYQPVSRFRNADDRGPRYAVYRQWSPALSRVETLLVPVIPEHQALSEREVLKVALTCSNGEAVDHLARGDISHSVGETPELVKFRNLTIPTRNLAPLTDEALAWSLISDLHLNYLSLADAESLKAVLRHYLPAQAREDARVTAALRRIDSIRQVGIQPDQTLFRNAFIHGQRLQLQIRGDHFSNEGDRYLFGSVLDELFASLATLNTFTALEFQDSNTGSALAWPIRLGSKTLL